MQLARFIHASGRRAGFQPAPGRNLSYWGDDSLRSGELLILDNLAAGAAKNMWLKPDRAVCFTVQPHGKRIVHQFSGDSR
jgi:hypothetical protein